MECIELLSKNIPGLDVALQDARLKNKSVKECFKTMTDNKPKCYKCQSTDYESLTFIQVKSTSRCSDELIESHYFCQDCRLGKR